MSSLERAVRAVSIAVPSPRVVHCVCCRAILAEGCEGPYLAVCDDCVSHERECNVETLETAYERDGDFIDTGTNPMRIA